MKSLLILQAVAFLFPTGNQAQQPSTSNSIMTCTNSVPFVAGRNVTFSLFDAENRSIGKMVYQYDRAIEGSYRVDKYDTQGKLRRSANGKMDCQPSVSNLDWTPKLLDLMAAYPGKDMKTGENQLAYPSTLFVGDALPDGAVNIMISSKGRTLVEVMMRATERRIEGMEQIRAGGMVYDAFKITYLQTVVTTTNNQASVPVLMRQTEWVVPTLGIVKTTTFHNTTGKMISGSVLSVLINDIPTQMVPLLSPVLEPIPDKTILELPTDLPSIKPE